jgi:Leucine-rich repeat (LRR) protein
MMLPRLQLSLRALMAIVLVLGGGVGWVIHRAHVQRDAIMTIERAGGSVAYGNMTPGTPGSVTTSRADNPVTAWVRRHLGRDFTDTATYVYLSGKQFDDEALRAACRLPWLEELWVENTGSTDLAAEDLQHLKRLRVLDLKLNRITGRPLRHIGEMSELRELNLAMRLSPVPLRDEDMAFLKRLTKLERLQLPSDELTDAWLAYIKDLKGLTFLQLYRMAVTSDGLRHLSALTNLTVLRLHGTRVNDLSALRPLFKLSVLDLSYTPAGDAALASLRGWPKLYDLDLRRTRITDTGLAALVELPALRSVDLSETNVTDAGLSHLAGPKALRSVRLIRTAVTDLGVAEFSKANPLVTVIR